MLFNSNELQILIFNILPTCLMIVGLLAALLAITQVLTFTPTSFSYNSFTLPRSQLACSSDFNICTAIAGGEIRLYQYSSSGYAFVSSAEVVCSGSSSCTLVNNYISEDGTRSICYSYTDSSYKVYSIANNSLTFLQSIAFVSPVASLEPVKGNYLLLGSSSNIELYLFNTTTSQYGLNYTANVTSSTSSTFSILPSGTFVRLRVDSGDLFQLDIYTLDSVTGTYSSVTIGINPTTAGAKSVIDAVLAQRGNTTVLITTLLIDSTYYFWYRTITPTNEVTVQQIATSTSPFSELYLTQSGLFLLAATYQNHLSFYQYNPDNDTYFNARNFTFSYQASQPFMSDNATFVLAAHTYLSTQYIFFFDCALPFCQGCSFIGSCSSCQSGYVLSGGACGCNAGETLVGTTCVSCNISNCGSCVVSGVCNSCANGYSLDTNSACACPSGSTVSASGLCVSCNIADCYRCDSANVCASYSPASLTVSPASSNGDVNVLWAVVAVLLGLVVFLGIFLAVLFKKMTTVVNRFRRVRSDAGREGESQREREEEKDRQDRTVSPLEDVGTLTKIKSAEQSPKKIKRRLRQYNIDDESINPID